MIPPHHFIHLSVLFLSRWPEYSGLTRNCFSFLSFHSLSFSNCVLAMQKIISALQFIFSCDSIPLLLFAIVLFTLIISYLILFSIHPWSFNFFGFVFNLILILLIAICFVLNHSLDWFVFYSTPRNLFSFNFYVKFDPNSFKCYFFNHFLNEFVYYNFIPKHLISIFIWLRILLLCFFGFAFNGVTLISWSR